MIIRGSNFNLLGVKVICIITKLTLYTLCKAVTIFSGCIADKTNIMVATSTQFSVIWLDNSFSVMSQWKAQQRAVSYKGFSYMEIKRTVLSKQFIFLWCQIMSLMLWKVFQTCITSSKEFKVIWPSINGCLHI
jgi:hypothetical protein